MSSLTASPSARHFLLGASPGAAAVAKAQVDSARSCRWLLVMTSFFSFHHLPFSAPLEGLQKVGSESNLVAGREVMNKDRLTATHKQSCSLR